MSLNNKGFLFLQGDAGALPVEAGLCHAQSGISGEASSLGIWGSTIA